MCFVEKLKLIGVIMEVLKDIQYYWNSRAPEYLSSVIEELANKSKVLDCGTGAGFFCYSF